MSESTVFDTWWWAQPDEKVDAMSPTQVAKLAWDAGQAINDENVTECWEAADARIAELKRENAELRAAVDDAFSILEESEELNMSNYHEDDVAALNDAASRAYMRLVESRATSVRKGATE